MGERFITAEIKGQRLELETRPGLFSPEHVDRGTLAMLSVARFEEGMQVLDLGCGWGPVGVTLARKYPDAEIVMSDVNARACELSARNLAFLWLSSFGFII